MKWPIVTSDDDGIRPAGKPDECLYCHRVVGEEHQRDCVTVEKIVAVRYTFEIHIKVPHSWNESDIEFSRNESSSCSNNTIAEVQEYIDQIEPQCLCNAKGLGTRDESFCCEFIKVVDGRPRTKTVKSE